MMTRLCSALATVIGTSCAISAGIATFAHVGLSQPLAVASLLVGLVAGLLVFLVPVVPEERDRKPGIVEWFVIAMFVLASLRAFLWLIYPNGGDINILSPYNLGDISLHIGLIRYLAAGIPFWPESQIITGESLRYPIGTDLFNSLLLLAGVPLRQGLIWVGLFGAAMTGIALWRWGRGFAIAALLFSGGLAGFQWFGQGFGEGNWSLRDFLSTEEWPWKNFFLTMLVTQRGLLFALPAGLLLLADWRARWFSQKGGEIVPLPAALLFYSTMPLYSVHTFLFLSITLLSVFCLGTRPGARKQSLLFVLAAVVPASVSMALITGFFSASSGVYFHPGWLQDDQPVWFWFRNFGLIPLLWILLGVVVIINRDRRALAFILPATVLFIACTLVSFAPWPWDNVKIMLWCWLAIVPFVWNSIINQLTVFPRAAILFCLFFSGALSLIAGLGGQHGYKLIARADLDLPAKSLESIPPDARFASAPEFNHPLILMGRPVAMGYDGHLWSHGYDYQPLLERLLALMDHDDDWQAAAAELDVQYLFWARPERQRYITSRREWADILPIVARSREYAIFALPATDKEAATGD